MAYEMWLGTMLCPVTPSKIDTKIKNQNKTINLMNGEEINVLNSSGLTEITFDLLLPNVIYPFATYLWGFEGAGKYLEQLERMKNERKPFWYKLIREYPRNGRLYDTNIMVSLEDYTIKESASQGFDVVVSVKLKQYRSYGTKIVKVLDSEGTASVEGVRETSNSPAPSDNPVTTYTVVEGDTLGNIAKKFYDDASKYTAIFEANKDKIANPNTIHPGQVLVIPKAPTTTTKNKSATQYNVAVKFGGSTTFYGSFDIKYTKNGRLQNEKDCKTPITVKADYNSDVTITIHPPKGGMGVLFSDTSSRRITWEKIGALEHRAKIYSNAVVTIEWLKF